MTPRTGVTGVVPSTETEGGWWEPRVGWGREGQSVRLGRWKVLEMGRGGGAAHSMGVLS